MTDKEITVELARFMGWKIAPEKWDGQWLHDDANFPCYDPRTGTVCEKPRGIPWRDWSPLTDWRHAMELARSDGVGAETLLREVRIMALKAYFPPGDEAAWLLERATPRDLALCVVRAVGIEAGK